MYGIYKLLESLVTIFISGLEPKWSLTLLLSSSEKIFCKIFAIHFLRALASKTAEYIEKCHTTLEMGCHDRSAYTFGSSHWFLEVPQKSLKKKLFSAFVFEKNVSSKFCHQISTTVAPTHGVAQPHISWNGLVSWPAGLALLLHHTTSNDSVTAQPFCHAMQPLTTQSCHHMKTTYWYLINKWQIRWCTVLFVLFVCFYWSCMSVSQISVR